MRNNFKAGIVFAVLAIVQLARANLWSVGCGIVNNDGIYDLKDLARSYYSFSFLHYPHNSWNDPWMVNVSGGNETILFNLCAKIRGCDTNVTSVWARKTTENGTCENITSDGLPAYSPQLCNYS